MKTSIHILSYLAHYFLEWEMFLTKFVAATNTHILYSIILFFESRAVYDMMCKNIVEPDISHKTVWRMHFAYWVPKAADTHS
jgi:hypothetical protein